ncbi:MAG: hypothetical protein WCO93_05435 [bacterium]
MKKNRTIFISVIVLAIVALVLFLTQSKTTFRRSMSDFAVRDTSIVTKIFMSDKNNNTLKLTRLEPGKWTVNDKFPAQKKMVDILLATMVNLEVKEPVAKAAHNTIIGDMAVNSIKVEIYQMGFRINIFGWIKLFPYEKLDKVYYVGGATPNNRGSYMLLENSTEPFVTYLPGLRGFVSPRYSPMEKYWRDFTVFKKSHREIASVRMEFPSNPDDSYEVRSDKSGGVTLLSIADNKMVPDFDTLKVLTFVSGFRDLNFEALLNDMDPVKKDSVLRSTPFIVITVMDTTGVATSVKVFHKPNSAGFNDMEGQRLPFDPDRLYALVNEGNDFVLIQYFAFNKVLRPKFFFLKNVQGKGKNIEYFYQG